MWVPMPEGRGVLYGRRMRTSHVLPFALLSLLLAGCPTEGGEAPVDTTVTYIEGEDGDNDEFDDPEEIDVVWTDRLLIEGSARECDWDNAEDWPWQGDLDNYLIFNPDRGYLEARLTWETDRIDLDLLEIVIEQNTITTGLTSQDNDFGPDEERLFWEDDFRTDEEVHLQVACSQGSDGDYVLEILWEE